MANEIDDIFAGTATIERPARPPQAANEIDAIFASGAAIAETPGQIAPQDTQGEVGLLQQATEPFKTFGQAFTQSLAAKPATALRGVTAFTREEAFGLDPVLLKTSEFIESLRNPNTKAEIEQKIQGRLFPVQEGDRWFQVDPKLIPEVINTWAANIGDQIPLMLMTLTGKLIGKAVGKPAGALAGILTAAPAGLDPTDAVTVPAIATATSKIVEHLGGAAPLIAVEAGGFLDQAEQMGIDKDIAEKYARTFGVGSGAVEYAQVLWNLKAFKRLAGPAKKTILKRVFTELGGSLFEGVEEFTQEGMQNFFIGKAIDDQKARTPGFKARKPEIFEGGGRAFTIGTGVSLVTRGFGKASVVVRDTFSPEAQAEVDQATEATVEAGKVEPGPTTVTAEPTPPTTVSEIFATKPQVQAVTPTTPTAPAVVTPQVSEGLEAKPEAAEGEVAVGQAQGENLKLDKPPKVVVASIVDGKLHIGTPADAHFQLLTRVLGEDVVDGTAGSIEEHDILSGFFDPVKKVFHPASKTDIKKAKDLLQPTPKAKPEAVTEKPTTISEIFAEKPITPKVKEKISAKAEPVKPVPATKIVSPGEAGPFKVTFKAKKDLPATRIIVDPKVRRSVQSAESKIAVLKTKLNQAKADKKQAVIKATTEQLQKAETQIAKLKERQEVKLINTIEKAKAKVLQLKQATQFKESLRRDAISMVRAIPKELQKDFIVRAGNAKTVANIQKLTTEIEQGIAKSEKRTQIKSLQATVKSVFRAKRLGRVKLGKLREKARQRIFDVLEGTDLTNLSSAKKSQLQQAEADLKKIGFNLEKGLDSLTAEEIDAIKVLDPRVEQIRRLTQKSISTLTADEIRDIEDAIRYFVKQDELEDLMLQEGRAVESAKVIGESSTEVMSTKSVKKKITDLTKKTGLGFTRNIRKAFIVESMHKGKLVQLATSPNTKTMRNVLDNFIHKAKGVSLGKEFEALDAWEAGKDKIGWTKADTRSLLETHEVRIAGQKKTMSTDQIMSIAKHLRSERNVGQLAKTVGLEIEGNKTGRMSLVEMVDTVDLLTDKQVALLDLTEEINVDILMPAVNETSLRIFGYELARNPQHWSLQRIGGKTVRGEVTKGPAIEDLGPFQPFIGGTRRLKISGFSEQWLWQIQTASFFHGSSIPIKNARTLLNNEDFQAAMIDGGREAELNSLITLFQRMQGVASDKAAFENFGSLLLSRSVRSILGFRVSSALAQLGSIPMAFDIIPAKYGLLLPGFKTQTGKAQGDRVNEFSPFLKMRMIGGRSTIETGDLGAKAAADMLLWQKTPLLDKPLDGLRKQDRKAIMVIDGAVQRWVADTTDLKPGTEEFWQEVKSREEDVVRFTQPMWDLDERSVLSGSPNVAVRSVLSFRAAREAMLNQSVGSIDEALKTGKTKQLINTAAAVTTSVAMVRGMKIALNSVLLAGATFALGFFGIERRRKKILSEQSAEKFAADTAFDLLGNLPGGDIAGNLIRAKVLGDRWREVRFDGVIGSLAQVIGETFESFTRAYQAKIDGNNAKFKKNLTEGLFDMVDSLARLTGLPASGPLAVTKQPIFRALNQPTQQELENKAARLLNDKLTARQIKRIKDDLNAFGITTGDEVNQLLLVKQVRDDLKRALKPKQAKAGSQAVQRALKRNRAIRRFTE